MAASPARPTAQLINYEVEVSAAALKSLAKLPKQIQLRIAGVISELSNNPLPPAAKKLTGRDAYRIRVRDYRIIYSINNNILLVVVVALGHRRDIYRQG